MTPPGSTPSLAAPRWAVCAEPHGTEADAIRKLLATEGVAHERWFHPKDAEDLDTVARAGQFDVVLFPDAPSLLDALFDGNVHLDEWAARRIRVRFVHAPLASSHEPTYASDLLTVAGAYVAWRTLQRKRRNIAGLVLSLVALACAVAVVLISVCVAPH